MRIWVASRGERVEVGKSAELLVTDISGA